jgi:hypothetical protein
MPSALAPGQLSGQVMPPPGSLVHMWPLRGLATAVFWSDWQLDVPEAVVTVSGQGPDWESQKAWDPSLDTWQVMEFEVRASESRNGKIPVS